MRITASSVAVCAALVLSVSACEMPKNASGGKHHPKAPTTASSLRPPIRWGDSNGGYWEVVGSIKVERGMNNDFSPDFTVRNLTPQKHTGYFTLRFFNHSKLLGKVANCTTRNAVNDQGVKYREVRSVFCEYGDTFKPGTTEVRISNSGW